MSSTELKFIKYECDQTKKTIIVREGRSNDTTPKGWITIKLKLPTDTYEQEYNFCNKAAMATFVKGKYAKFADKQVTEFSDKVGTNKKAKESKLDLDAEFEFQTTKAPV